MFVRKVSALLALIAALSAAPAYAQQTGSIVGKVMDSGGAVLPGVTVEARGDVLPAPRVTTSGVNGEYRFPALPPGAYSVSFTLSGMQTQTRQVLVQLQADTVADAMLAIQGVTETVTVTAATSLVDPNSSTIKSGVTNEQIMSLPVGQEYRDLVKLIPGVQYTQDATRGPSSGGSGQDNVYQFDGANVTLPLFGTLASEPASHDIAQVTTIKGGARAIDFDRSGGFTIDSVSKSGTSRFRGELSYQLQNDNMAAKLDSGQISRFEQDRTWLTGNVGGPIVPEKLFFYASYYRPESSRANRANAYGELPQFERTRNEGFGKLTFNPISSILLNVSYRDSHRLDKSALFGAFSAPTTGTGDESWQKIATGEGSWVINSRSHMTFKATHFGIETSGRPDNISTATPTTTVGAALDINNLDQMGAFSVPTPVANATAYNAFIQPFLDRYGYVSAGGARTGGGVVGFASQFNDQDFFRNNYQVAYNMNFGSGVTHDLHVGFQWYKDSEDLLRSSNGWGGISVPGGRLAPIAGTGQSAFFTARFQAQTTGAASPIVSEYISKNIEVNDAIKWNRLTLNLGVVASNDTLFGQGLREDSSRPLTGMVAAPGMRYEMYDIPFSKMIQPRLAATYAYNGTDTIYGSFARYNPAASSLPRAASWDRNLIGKFIDAHFDANGVLFSTVDVGSSSGKLFQEDMDPRTIDEYLVGTAKEFRNGLTARAYYRTRRGSNFWEDTNNNARVAFNAPADIAAKGLYIPDLTARLAEITSGSSYVIAELDNAFTRYHEATLESEWRGSRAFVRGSYTWSKYYGTLDQDNSTTDNDQNIFIGSSNIADGAGRQLWDNKEGRLRGDRPHLLKLYGYHELPWRATLGGYFVAQSGQPWETWNYELYSSLTTNTSDTIRYAEPAGSRRADAHWQLDMKYIQNFRLQGRLNLQLDVDVFNVLNNQTGYSIQPAIHSSGYGTPRLYFDPRRAQVAVRFQF
ncbi:MAG: carboxypeptidase-like regulatory domain-containing protein [Acidobacteriota bacterium]|nr:carboxypeptidase-like regulatory domain-containing protein [Acidobacteriota bacterium]